MQLNLFSKGEFHCVKIIKLMVIQNVLWAPVQDFIQIKQKTQKMQEIFDLYSKLKVCAFHCSDMHEIHACSPTFCIEFPYQI